HCAYTRTHVHHVLTTSQPCSVNKSWDNRVNATLVYKGRVLPAETRYQGGVSRARRGIKMEGWNLGVPPTNGTLLGFNFRVYLPRYGEVEGLKDMIWKNNYIGCYLDWPLGATVAQSLG